MNTEITKSASTVSENSTYRINTECEMIRQHETIAVGSSTFDDASLKFIGISQKDIIKIISDAYSRFYSQDESSGLAPHVDQSEYQQYVNEKSLELFTEKAIATNNINPEMKSGVKNFLQMLINEDACNRF